MEAQPVANTCLHARWLAPARAGWVFLALVTILFYSADLPVRFDELRRFFAHDGRALLLLGPSPDFYAYYFSGLDLSTVLLYSLAALLLFWRKSDDWMVLLVSLTLVAFGAGITPATDALQTSEIRWRLTFAPLQTLARALSILVLYLFPDGRFVPRWTQPLAILYVVWLASSFVFPTAPFSWYAWPLSLFVLVFTSWYASGALAQIYRYLRESNPVQRQQTKWIVFGFAIAVAARVTFALSATQLPALRTPRLGNALWLLASLHLIWFCLLLVPLTICIAILRYRLWDIDLIIRRTLLYSALSALLALIYAGSVILLQQIILRAHAGQASQLAVVISTLAIAVLFTPLRQRLQNVIDRHFYRRRYDAERVLAAFSTTVRNQVELDQLAARLVAVVNETMQPTHVSLWLRSPAKLRRHPDQEG